jgi:cation diffusion facilitator family transporter
MIADGVHSFSDFITDIIVIAFVGISHKKADANYQYGHGKYETFATMLISMALAAVAIMLFIEGAHKVWQTLNGEILPRPGYIALVAAVVSIVVKEWLFRYTLRHGKRIKSSSVIANAWHHRSDAYSSAATLLGIAGAMFFGDHWRILDPLAAMLVSVFIVIVALRIGLPSVRELLDASLSGDIVDEMRNIIYTTPGVKAFHHFRSRRNGNRIIVDAHIKVDPQITVEAGHIIASNVEAGIRNEYGADTIINIHIEPYYGEQVDNEGHCKETNP